MEKASIPGTCWDKSHGWNINSEAINLNRKNQGENIGEGLHYLSKDNYTSW